MAKAHILFQKNSRIHQNTYDEWKEMSTERKENSVRLFLNAQPKKISSPCNTTTERSSAPKQGTAPLDLNNDHQQPCDHSLDMSILVEDSEEVTINTNVACDVSSILAEEASLPEESIRLGTLQQIFHKAEFLIIEPSAIKEAVSNDSRFRTVKSQSGGTPLIVRPVSKKSNLFTCECSTFKGVGMCPDTVAVAETQGLLFEYITDLRAKFTRQKARKKNLIGVNITAAIETGLKITEKGHKPNEVSKKVQRRSKKSGAKESFSSTCTTKPPLKNVTPTAPTTGFENEIGASPHQPFSRTCTTNPTAKQIIQATPSVFLAPTEYRHQFEAAVQHQPVGMVTGLQQPHQIFEERQLGAPYRYLHAHLPMEKTSVNTQKDRGIASNIQPDLNVYQPNPVNFLHPPPLQQPNQNFQQEQFNWHAGMSPHPYTLCILSPIVKKCYGCGDNFIDKYRLPPCNINVKHVDRRVMQRDEQTRQFLYSPDFSNAYNHPSSAHIGKKNPFFPGIVTIDRYTYERLTEEQRQYVATFDFEIQIL